MALNTNKHVQGCGKPNPKITIFPPNMYWPFHQHTPISDTSNLYEVFYPPSPQSLCSFRAGQQERVKPPEEAFIESCMWNTFLLRSSESSYSTLTGKLAFIAFKDFFVQFTNKAIYATKCISNKLLQNPTRSIKESSISLIFSAGSYTAILKHDTCGQIFLKAQKPLDKRLKNSW